MNLNLPTTNLHLFELFSILEYEGDRYLTVQNDKGDLVSLRLKDYRLFDGVFEAEMVYKPDIDPIKYSETYNILIGDIVVIGGKLHIIVEKLDNSDYWRFLAIDVNGNRTLISHRLESSTLFAVGNKIGKMIEC